MLKIKKLIPALLLTIVSTSVLAEWTEIGIKKHGDVTMYVDLATIRKKGNKAKIWSLADLKTPKESPSNTNKKYLSAEMQDQYDCEEETARLIAINFYSGNMGTGEVLGHETYTSSELLPQPIPPGSMGERILKIVCGIK